MYHSISIMRKVFYILIIFSLLFSCKPEQQQIVQDTLPVMAEKHRPQFHFSPEANWMNDPNGMVFLDGEYHLFYQYYPDSTVWGPMHWGHAISADMVHWEHLPIALYPDSLGYIFSGSAVFDEANTSGLGENGRGPLIAIFTHHQADLAKSGSITYQNQSIAYSNDKGRTWTKYGGNPVLSNPGIKDFRDPKVMWHDASNSWVMTLAADDRINFYASPDLKTWKETGEFGTNNGGHGGVWECPDLFLLEVTETGEKKWVLLVSINPGGPNGGSATQYFVGDFDGNTFTLDKSFAPKVPLGSGKWLDQGKDNYAGVTWSNIPKDDGRRLFLGWMSNWQYAQEVPTEVWRSATTIARNITLHKSDGQYEIRSLPVDELSNIESGSLNLQTGLFKQDTILSTFDNSPLQKLSLKFKKPESGLIALRLSNSKNEYVDIGYNTESSAYFVDRTFAGDPSFSKDFADLHEGLATYSKDEIELLVYLDVSSIELFADGGKTVMTEIYFPSEPFNKLELLTASNSVELIEGSITALKSIWNRKGN